MQSGKGVSADSGHWVEDPIEDECSGCSRIRIQFGAIGANRAFELETLSQHRHMIEKLQDESYAQRSQLEEHRTKMEAMQRRLDQLEGAQHPPSNPGDQQENSKNEQSTSVNQIPDLNEPHPETMLEIQQVKLEKGN
jgi:septal ring factor EnvC (AmiA/AmiB activator)